MDEVVWDPLKEPTILKLHFSPGTLTKDMMLVIPSLAEVYLTVCWQKAAFITPNPFCASERRRQVVVRSGSGNVFDTETMTEFQVVGGDGGGRRIQIRGRGSCGSRWGEAVSFLNYGIIMRRMVVDDSS